MKYLIIIRSIKARIFSFLWKPFFADFGKKSLIYSPLRIDGMCNITIGDRVRVSYCTWLAALPNNNDKTAGLVIGSGTCIGNFNHIYATKSIIIGKKVLTADRVYISDNLHSFENIRTPIIEQPIKQIATVEIGDGSWLGENVCVIGAKIGKNCVIGANSVVTKNIPDFSVAIGAPAKIVKRYCLVRNNWFKTNSAGDFIEEIIK